MKEIGSMESETYAFYFIFHRAFFLLLIGNRVKELFLGYVVYITRDHGLTIDLVVSALQYGPAGRNMSVNGYEEKL